jgi:hypothetical protein
MGDKFDIPPQKQACQEFVATRQDWEPYHELSEFGVSTPTPLRRTAAPQLIQ